MTANVMRALLSLVVGLILVGAAQADPLAVTAKLNGVSPAVQINFKLQDKAGSPALQSTSAGSFNWTTVSTNSWLGAQFSTFCIELNQYISPGSSYTYSVVNLEAGTNPGVGIGGPGTTGPLGQDRADKLRQLWGMHYDEVNSNITAAAFQIAIWEIIYGQYFTPYTTGAAAATAAINLSNAWVADVQVRDESQFEHRLVAITNGTAQDQLTLHTPVPASLVLAGVGMVSVLGWTRRRRGEK